jgi:hypothetical protein
MNKVAESPWFTPAIVIAAIGLALAFFYSRFASIDAQYVDTGRRVTDLVAKFDRRTDGLLQSIRDTNARIDTVLQQQTTLASQVGRVEVDMGYVRSRLDKISEKLQVAELEPQPTAPTLQSMQSTPIPQPRPPSGPTLAGTPPFTSKLDHPEKLEDGILSQKQFEQLYTAIKQQPDPAFSSALNLKVGEKLPPNAPVKPLPTVVKEIRPSWENLNYTVGKAGIAIINPSDKSVMTLVSFPPNLPK